MVLFGFKKKNHIIAGADKGAFEMSINSANLIETYTFKSSKEVITTGGMIVQYQIRNKQQQQQKIDWKLH